MEMFVDVLARAITKAVINLPFAVGMIWFAVRQGLCELADLPRPTWRQMLVIASAARTIMSPFG